MPEQPQFTSNTASLKRPFSVTLLIIEVLIITGLNGFRCLAAFRYWDFLSSIKMSVSPVYLALSGAFWFLIGSVLIWVLWRGKPGAPKALRALTVFYGLYYWVDRWLLMISITRERWLFALLMTAFGLVFTFATLTRPKVSKYFVRKVQ